MRLDSLIFAVAAFGVTLSTSISGPQTLLYYVFVALFFLPLISWRHFSVAFSPVSIIIILIPLVILLPQAIVGQAGMLSWTGFQRQLSLSAVLFLACWLARVDDTCRRQFFALAAVAHGCFAFIAYWRWNPSTDWERLATLGLGTAPWAEFSLAAILAAVCTGDRRIVLLCTALVTPTLIGTQMRSGYIAAAVALLIFFYPTFRGWAAWLQTLIVAGGAVLGAVFYASIFQGISEALLFDDPHRGVQTGFSGRFDSWNFGFNVFLDHFLFGAGTEHPIVKHVHNAFIKIAAEQGVFGLILMVSVIILAFIYACRRRDFIAIAVMSGWFLFIMTAPRYISFSFGIFLGWVIVMQQFSSASADSRSQLPRMDKPGFRGTASAKKLPDKPLFAPTDPKR